MKPLNRKQLLDQVDEITSMLDSLGFEFRKAEGYDSEEKLTIKAFDLLDKVGRRLELYGQKNNKYGIYKQ